MTGQEDSHGSTRPISVAELLAKNGTIGAPPVGGRRRRSRGNSDSVTVAELTGEIPIVGAVDDEPETTRQSAVAEEPVDVAEPVASNGLVHHDDNVETGEVEQVEAEYDNPEFDEVDDDDEYAGAVAEYTAHVEQRDTDADLDFFEPPRRSQYAPRRFQATSGSGGTGAEQMSPDPLDDEEELPDSAVHVADAPEIEDLDTEIALDAEDRDPLPSYLRSTDGPLFGGQTVADDLARRGGQPTPEDIDLDDESDTAAPKQMSPVLRGAWVVGQCILAVAFGAGLFIAFDQLWKWNNIVALVLSVLVILGLVVGVRVVRKTEDIGSTLIAVAVGALVTLGPLALLQSG